MATLQELMYGPGTAQAYSVPDPNASMADLLAGGVPAAAPAPAGSVATAYADSPAPGGVASAAAQAQSAAAQEPGIIDRARDWAMKNPGQAQALMQGFSALASGRTRGGFVQQLGQAAGVAGQTMVEQNAANAAQAEEQRRYQTKDQRAAAESESVITNRNSDNARQDRATTAQIASNEASIRANDERVESSRQQRGFNDQLQPKKMQELNLRLQKLNADIAAAPDEATLRRLNLEKAKLEYDNFKLFGTANAEAEHRRIGANATAAEERAGQETLESDAKARAAEADKLLTPQQRLDRANGVKPKAPLDPETIGRDLLTRNADLYQKPDGSTDYAKLAKDVNAVLSAGKPGGVQNARQEALNAARNAVPVGGRYIFEGVERIRKQ